MPNRKPAVKYKIGRVVVPGDLWMKVKIAAAEDGVPTYEFVRGIIARHFEDIRRREALAPAGRGARSAA